MEKTIRGIMLQRLDEKQEYIELGLSYDDMKTIFGILDKYDLDESISGDLDVIEVEFIEDNPTTRFYEISQAYDGCLIRYFDKTRDRYLYLSSFNKTGQCLASWTTDYQLARVYELDEALGILKTLLSLRMV